MQQSPLSLPHPSESQQLDVKCHPLRFAARSLNGAAFVLGHGHHFETGVSSTRRNSDWMETDSQCSELARYSLLRRVAAIARCCDDRARTSRVRFVSRSRTFQTDKDTPNPRGVTFSTFANKPALSKARRWCYPVNRSAVLQPNFAGK